MTVDVNNESGMSVDEAGISALARHVLDEMRTHPLAELSVVLVDEPAMTDLHVKWMDEPGPTDVLAFPMDELRPHQPGGSHAEAGGPDPAGIPELLGDVVICPQVAAAQARRARHALADEIDLLCVHGILHLLGYDHDDAPKMAEMFGLQDRLLASWRGRQAPDGPDEAGQGEAGQGEAAPGAGGGGPGAGAAPGAG